MQRLFLNKRFTRIRSYFIVVATKEIEIFYVFYDFETGNLLKYTIKIIKIHEFFLDLLVFFQSSPWFHINNKVRRKSMK